MTLPTTRDRVPGSTADEINRRIDQEIADNVREATVQGRISQRIGELDAEWDIERAIEMNASALAFIGTALGFFCASLLAGSAGPGDSFPFSARTARLVPARPRVAAHGISHLI